MYRQIHTHVCIRHKVQTSYLHKIKQKMKQFKDALIQNKNDQIMVEKGIFGFKHGQRS
jgi:hypothetical protein